MKTRPMPQTQADLFALDSPFMNEVRRRSRLLAKQVQVDKNANEIVLYIASLLAKALRSLKQARDTSLMSVHPSHLLGLRVNTSG